MHIKVVIFYKVQTETSVMSLSSFRN